MGVQILILGAGWTSTFLIPLCSQRGVSYAATSRSGRPSTIKFQFDPDSEDVEPFRHLPDARTIVITFPIENSGGSQRLVRLYQNSRSGELQTGRTAFIQLGSSGIWGGNDRKGKKDKPVKSIVHTWYDRHSPFTPSPRSIAEDELLSLSSHAPTTVLNLAGLWGESRTPHNWVTRVAPTKEALRNKGSIHLIHGLDVARAILAIHAHFFKAEGQRWILADGRVYDWWDLASAWGSPNGGSHQTDESSKVDNQRNSLETSPDEKERGPQPRWVRELMAEQNVRALPRNVELLGRALDSRDFWETFEISPIKALLED